MIDAAFAEFTTNPEMEPRPFGERLAAALIAFAEELEALATSTLAANKRGAKGKATIYTEGAALLRGRAAELETHGPISAAARSAMTPDENTRPTREDMAALDAFVKDRQNMQVNGSQPESTALEVGQSLDATARPDGSVICGIADEMGYICEREPHAPGTGPHHLLRPDGSVSVQWPDERIPPVEPVQSGIVAFLKGETDELPEVGPTGVVDLGPASPALIEALAAANPSMGVAIDPTLVLTEVASMQDPFSIAPAADDGGEPDPFAIATAATLPAWRLEPAPVPFAFDPSTALPAPDHVSYSQIKTAGECGLQLRIKKRDGIKGQPGYAAVGGTAFHACVELVERRRLGLVSHGIVDQVLAGDLAACAALFVHNFDLEIANAVRESGIPVEKWKTAAQGTEGDAWWRHNGALMVRDYVAWANARHEDGWAILHIPGKTLGIELELNEPVGRDILTGAEVMLNSRIDQVWFKWEPAGPTDPDGVPTLLLHIEDGKSGAKVDAGSTFQLGLYGHVLHRMILREFPPPVAAKAVITASYYDARNGKSTDAIPPLALHSWAEVEYRSLTTLGMHEAGIYPANPNAAYGGPCGLCDVRHACPIMAMRD